MNRYEIYVEGQLIDIDPKQVIAITLQASEIGSGNITVRNASFTNQISAPRTNNNITIFEYANFINGTSTFPYLTKSVQVLCNSVRILIGIVVIKSFDTHFNLQIYSLPKDLSFAIGNKSLNELDFGDSPITWNQAYMDSVRASTSGFCAPLINYGQIDISLANGTIGDYYLPAVAYKTIIAAIFENAGYTTSGTFYSSDTYFTNMALSYSKKTWPGTSIKMNDVLADDIKQADFLRDFLVKFNCFLRIAEGDVEILQFDAMVADITGPDWSGKRATPKQVVSFTWSGWAQRNNFTYPPPDSIASYGGASNGYISVSNDNINLNRSVYDSIFSIPEKVADNSNAGAGQIFYKIATVAAEISGATTPVYDTIPSNFTFDHDPKPMLLLLKDILVTQGPSLLYNGSVRTDFKVGFFGVNANIDYNEAGLKWRDDPNLPSDSLGLLDRYYAGLETILQTTKMTTRYYVLKEADIATLDLLVPIFDEGYYLISKVYDFVPGRLTKVDLLKIS